MGDTPAGSTPFLISVIVLTTWLGHHASSYSISQAQSFHYSWHSRRAWREGSDSTLHWPVADYENAPQGSTKLGLESPFCPWDTSMMSHHSALQQRSSLLWLHGMTYSTDHYRNKEQPLGLLHLTLVSSFNRPSSYQSWNMYKVASRKALHILQKHLQHAFQDRPNGSNSFC